LFQAPDPEPGSAPAPVTVDEHGAEAPSPQPPAKLSKLSVAMQSVSAHMTAIQALDATIAEVEQSYPATHVFAVATKEGYKLADRVRADARKSRLHVADMRKQGTDLLNGLKSELWAVADPQMARLQAIEDNAKAQIAAQDAKEAERIAGHERNLAAITRMAEGVAGMRSADIFTRRASLLAIVVDDSYQEYEERAKKAHAEVAQVLVEAYEAALRAEEAELARRQAEARQTRAREDIAKFKAMPGELRDTGVENIRLVARGLQADVENGSDAVRADQYGDLAEFVVMAEQQCIDALRKLADEEERAAAPAVMVSPISPEEAGQLADRIETVLDADLVRQHAADDGPEVLAPQDEQTEPHPFEPTLEQFAEAHSAAHPVDEDPFSPEAMRAAQVPVSTGPLAGIANGMQPPAPRRVVRAAIPTAAPTQAPAIAAATHALDTYQAARQVRAAYIVMSDEQRAALPAVLRAALEALVKSIHTN
jgi:hypothetical protein